MLDYKCLEALAHVLTEGGFEKAARTLHLTQSAVSQRVKALEDQVGQILLIRSTPSTPTDAGREMLKHYRQVSHLEGDLSHGIAPDQDQGFTTLPVALNADSLSTWFLGVIEPFLKSEKVLVDLRVDDQDATHGMLRNGNVLGCVSSQATPMQGCRVTPLRTMTYRMLASPEFARKWFPHGVTLEAAATAPVVFFNRKDELQNRMLTKLLGQAPDPLPVCYCPGSIEYVRFISAGLAYGMLPDEQSCDPLALGQLADLAPGCSIEVDLYWHCWNLKSSLLDRFTKVLERGVDDSD